MSADPSMVASIFFGLFESAEIRFVRRYVASDLDCLELGSGIGLVSRAIAETLQPGRLLVCVEPRADLLVCAKENIRSVAQGLRCRYISALVDRMERSDAGFPILADWINARMSGVGGANVRTVTLRELAKEFPGRFQVVCDIEGAEESFLEEACSDVLGRVARMIIELHETDTASVDDLIERSVKLGFGLVDRYGSVCAFVRL